MIVVDETTDNGYPVKAQIKVVAEGYQTPEKEVAHTFSLADVSIDGDNRLTHNRDEAIREICSWDVLNNSTIIAIPMDSVPRVILRAMAGIRQTPSSRSWI